MGPIVLTGLCSLHLSTIDAHRIRNQLGGVFFGLVKPRVRLGVVQSDHQR